MVSRRHFGLLTPLKLLLECSNKNIKRLTVKKALPVLKDFSLKIIDGSLSLRDLL